MLVTRSDLWPAVATHLSLPPAAGTNGLRSSPHVGDTLRKFFLELLGGLEILWDQTRDVDNSRPDSQRAHQMQQQLESQPHSRATSHFASAPSGSHGRYDDRATSQPYVQPRQTQQAETGTSSASQSYNRTNNYYGNSTAGTQPAYTAPATERYEPNRLVEPRQLHTNALSSSSRQRAPVLPHATTSTMRSHHGTMAPSDMHLHQMALNNASQAQPTQTQSTESTAAPEPAAPAQPKPSTPRNTKKQNEADAAEAAAAEAAAAAAAEAEAAAAEAARVAAFMPPPTLPTAPGASASKKKGKKNAAEKEDLRLAREAAKQAADAWKNDGYSDRPGQAALSAASASTAHIETTDPDDLAPAPSAPAASSSSRSAIIVLASQDGQPKKKRIRRNKEQIAADNAAKAAAKEAAKAAKAAGVKAAPAPPAPIIRRHADGVAIIDSFDELVAWNVLPLPPASPDVVAEPPSEVPRYYAARCQELRSAVTRNSNNERNRQVSSEEVHFWNDLGELSTVVTPSRRADD